MDKLGKLNSDGRGVDVADFHSTESPRTVRASVWYQKGRGNVLNFQLCDIKQEGRFESMSFIIFQDPSQTFVLDNTARFNKNVMLAWAENEAVIQEKLKRFTNQYKLGEWA